MSESSDDKRYYLDLIHYNAAAALHFISGMTFEEYRDDLKTQYACERAILSVSEAARDLERAGQTEGANFRLSEISESIDWRNVKGIGNVMRHDYDDIRAEVTWHTIADHFPTLQAETQRALQQHSAFYDPEPDRPHDDPEQDR